MSILDFVGLIADVFKIGYNAVTKRPNVTCDVKGVFQARWSPDYMPDGKGGTEAEGIEIWTRATIQLANSGFVDTTVKDAYVVCRSGKKALGRLRCMIPTKQSDYGPPLSGVVIEPRRVWGPNTISIRGTLWHINELPKDLESELIVEVLSQRSVKKKFRLVF